MESLLSIDYMELYTNTCSFFLEGGGWVGGGGEYGIYSCVGGLGLLDACVFNSNID